MSGRNVEHTMTEQELKPAARKNGHEAALNLHLAFWKNQLGENPPVLELPADRPRRALQTYRCESRQFTLSAVLIEALRRVCQDEDATLLEGLLVVYQILLQRYTGQNDPVVAAAIGRNTLALRADMSDNPTYRELLRRTRQSVQAAQRHDALLLAQLARELYPQRDPSSLFQTAFVFQNGSTETSANSVEPLAEAGSPPPQVNGALTKLDVAFSLAENPNGWEGTITYNADLFDEATIRRMAGHYETLLAGAIANPDTRIALLPILPEEEWRQVVVEWNATHVPFPFESCLHHLFEAQAAQRPEAVALVFNEAQLTYGELNRRANKLAHYLQKLGVGPTSASDSTELVEASVEPDVLVGVYMERSLEMVIGLYGILKAGGAYVPLDPAYPASRLSFMIEDTQVKVLLTQEKLSATLRIEDGGSKMENDNSRSSILDSQSSIIDPRVQLICLDKIWETIAAESEANPVSGVTPEHLAYVIYTSGSTGRPKGAVLNHRGRVNNFCDFNRRYAIGPEDRLLGISSLSFDMSAYDTFGTLAVGGTLVLVETAAILEPERWAELMIDQHITVWHSVPALLEMLVNYCSDRSEICPRLLRLTLLGGDWIPVSLPDRLKAMIPGVHVVSMGGATEVSMDSTIYDIDAPSSGWKSIPYGVPMYNQLAYVLDAELQPLPIGIPGELHLGGIGVGRGYWNRPELTAQKFIPNSFSGVPGDRMYKTGDLARYRPNSNLELLGRIDFQVKIRGFRIELGEITSALASHPALKEAVVFAKEEKPGQVGSEKRLVAYVVPQLQSSETASATISELPEEQMQQWQRIYDETYVQDVEDPTFNVSTWNSSYTGLPLSAEEMREWVNQSIDRILALQPKRVLEVGCGTGLMLFRIAPHCEKYVGMDFSQAALDYIRRQLAKPEYRLPQVELWHRPADNFEGIAPESFDLVILNSVAQFFPNPHYLVQVLEKAAAAVHPGGYIFGGDIFSLPHLELFHTSVQLYQAPASLSLARLQQRIQKAVSQHEQLHFDPMFFYALKKHLPRISHVQMQLRRGRCLNEMARFRYDVTLHIGGAAQALGSTGLAEVGLTECSAELTRSLAETSTPRWLDWQERKLTVARLRELLQKESPETLGLRRVPNARLFAEIKAKELLASLEGPPTVGELREALRTASRADFIDPEELWAIAENLPYEVDITWSVTGDAGCFDVLFRRRDAVVAKRIVSNFLAEEVRPKPWSEYANNSLQDKLGRKLVPELRSHLQKQLPEYMMPSAFVLLDALPLSPNGKIDRRALPAPDHSRPELIESFAAPRHALEEVVAQVWAEIFAFESIGLHVNFLVLGGHSLLAIQIMTRLQEIFPVKLPLAYLFSSPTVAELSASIEQAGREAQIDLAEISRVFLEVSRFSDTEVEKMLAEETVERIM
jgi:amino acid adenylation domain-containing protein